MLSVLDVLQNRPQTPTLKKHAISYMRDRTKSLEYTRDVIRVLEKQVHEEIFRLGGNSSLQELVDYFVAQDMTTV